MHSRSRRAALARLLAVTAGVTASGAVAQQAQEPLPTIAVGAEAPADARREAAEPVELETVYVTGELLTREAAQTVSSVALLTGAQIERSTVRDVYDVLRATPNAAIEDSDYGFGGMLLRGIGSYGASGAGAYASYGTTSVVVLDGVGLPRSALAYADLSAFDLDTVEVFRGPQSTSQGRNAMAGAMIVNSVAPEPLSHFSPQIRGRVALGNQGSHQYAGAAEATLWPEVLALRVVHDDRADDGDVRNATRSESDAARRDSRSTRIRLAFQPGGPDGAYRALFSASDLRRYQGSSYVQLEHEGDRTALNDQPQDYDNQARLYALDQRLRFSDAWSLRAVSAWFDSETFSRFDTDYSQNDYGATQQWEDSTGFSQELRLSYAGERLRGSFGVYYYDEDNGDDQSGYLDLNFFLQGTPLCEVPMACSLPLGRVVYDSSTPSKVTDMAVFGELDWLLADRLTLTLGLRADREDNSRVLTTNYTGDTLASTLLVTSLKGSVLPADGSVPVSREFSEVLPKLALRYEVFDGWFAGAAYSEGYRPGGDGYNQVSGRYFTFDSEYTRNAELSFKGVYAPWRLQSAFNLFYTRWDDMQVQGGSGTDTYIENAGRATIYGGEWEMAWRAFKPLQIVGGLGVTHGRFDRFRNLAGDDLSGNRLPKAPEYSGALALEITPFKGLLIRPDITLVGMAPANPDNRTVHELPAYQLLNLAVRWQLWNVGLFFTGTNLTDENFRKDANDYGSAGYDVVSLGERRRLVGGLEFQF